MTLDPDPHMHWIYDYTHPDYNSDEAKSLRERRARALDSAPQWMIEAARLNECVAKLKQGES